MGTNVSTPPRDTTPSFHPDDLIARTILSFYEDHTDQHPTKNLLQFAAVCSSCRRVVKSSAPSVSRKLIGRNPSHGQTVLSTGDMFECFSEVEWEGGLCVRDVKFLFESASVRKISLMKSLIEIPEFLNGNSRIVLLEVGHALSVKSLKVIANQMVHLVELKLHNHGDDVCEMLACGNVNKLQKLSLNAYCSGPCENAAVFLNSDKACELIEFSYYEGGLYLPNKIPNLVIRYANPYHRYRYQ